MRPIPALSLAAVLMGAACSPGTTRTGPAGASRPVSGENLISSAREALSAMISDYVGNQSEAFLSRLDSDRFPNVSDFGENVHEFLLMNRQIDLDVIVDNAVTQGDVVSVQGHWNRGYLNKEGARTLDKGECELIFRRSGPGRMVLSAIHGRSPF